ncbi:PucR family transcriptional regulator [Streptomyces prasinopilosus]|uniref:PucR family transcriptional regulator n=1 Tax=Streptomyces prasinopilosus TaxID=67344 RepID=UPI0006EBAC87|nr:PucR family transcriptional regulator [Streptomyces prasinopilosus]
MPLTLASLAHHSALRLTVRAGEDGLDVPVRWAHASELADPVPYMEGGELLLITALTLDAEDPAAMRRYVKRLVEAGVVGLGFAVGVHYEDIPEALVEAAREEGLPLLEVPPRTTFSGVARAVWQLMAQARLAELRRVTEAHRGLASAAARSDPVPSVLHRLSRHLDGRAVLFGPEGTQIAAAGRALGEETDTALAKLAEVVRPVDPDEHRPDPAGSPGPGDAGPASPAGRARPRPSPASAADTVAGIRLAAYALGAGHGFVLGVAAPPRDSGDHTVASVAAVLLSLLTGEQHSGTGAARSAALVRLLLGGGPEEVAPLLGGERWRVVHAHRTVRLSEARSPEARSPGERGPEERTPDALAASALGAALGSALVDPADGIVRVLVPAGREPEAQTGWTLGVSAAVAPHDWPAADTQAARALARARATRAPLVVHGARPVLDDLVPAADARAHARTLLAPLAGTPALADTLRTWLSLHGGWDRTAVALSVHRNTVRQRIARCAALLNADLDDPDVRMNLWFALRHT